MSEAYLVFRAVDRLMQQRRYLRLSGPFKYPSWHANPEEGTQLRMSEAVQYASILGPGTEFRTIREIASSLMPTAREPEPIPVTERTVRDAEFKSKYPDPYPDPRTGSFGY